MAITFQTGSGDISSNLATATISDTVLTGIGSFSEELTDLIAVGYLLDGMMADGTNYVAFLHKKYTKAF